MVSREDAEFHEGIKRVVSLCFLVQALGGIQQDG